MRLESVCVLFAIAAATGLANDYSHGIDVTVSAGQDQANWNKSNTTCVTDANHYANTRVSSMIVTIVDTCFQPEQTRPIAFRQHSRCRPGRPISVSSHSGSGTRHSTARLSSYHAPAPHASTQDLRGDNADENERHLEQGNGAIRDLVAMHMSDIPSPNIKHRSSTTRSNATPTPSYSSTEYDHITQTVSSPAILSLQGTLLVRNNAFPTLTFLNNTWPSRNLPGHTPSGHNKDDPVVTWQTSTNESATSAIDKSLTTTKDLYPWAQISYYWARIIFFVAGGIYALYRSIAFVRKIGALRCERQVDSNTPHA